MHEVSLSKRKTEDTEEVTHEKKYGFIPKKTPVDQAVLHLEFPLEAYWRKINVKRVTEDKIENVEGMIYPSFSDVVFTADYKISQLDDKEFLIHSARGYVPCPLCGTNIATRIENYEYEVKRPIRKFTREVAYEIVISALSKELSFRTKNHIEKVHGYKFELTGREKVLIARYVGGEEVIIEAFIAKYRCLKDKEEFIGVNGILDHVVNYHENTEIASEVKKFVGEVRSTTEKLLNLGRESIPILGAFRSDFSYVLVPDTGKTSVRLIDETHFKPWLRMKLVERSGRVDLIAVMTVPRPMRLIYHYPLFRYVPHVLAYKMSPERYLRFMNRVEKYLNDSGYNTENLEKMVGIITGGLVYTDIEPKNAFSVDIKTLESMRKKVEEKATDLRIFLSHRVV